MPAHRACFLFVLAFACACGEAPEGEGTVALSWTFLDGRSCSDSGVERVVARPGDQAVAHLETFCASGYGAARARFKLPAGAHSLVVEGMSAQVTPLYSGRVQLDLEAGAELTQEVKLAFIGGR